MFRNKFVIVSILLVFSMLFISGCYLFADNVKNNETVSNKTELPVYDISRDTFNEFIKDFSSEVFKNQTYCYYYTNSTHRNYISNGVTRLEIDEDFLKTISQKTYIEQNFLNNGSKCEAMFAFWAPEVPITIFVETATENICITINEKKEDEGIKYRIYSQEEYHEKYCCLEGNIIINGKEISLKNKAKIYGTYSQIPLVETLKAIGAKVVWKSDSIAKITYNNNIFTLNIKNREFYEKKNHGNSLSLNGVWTFIDDVEGDLLVDDTILNSVLFDMGYKVEIFEDRLNSSVIINDR